MLKLKEKYSAKDKLSREMLSEAFEFKNKLAPYAIMDCNYWLFGDLPDVIPDDYCGEDPAVMTAMQLDKIRKHYEVYKNDYYVGFLMPWFGTGVLASAFGTPVEFLHKMDPAVGMSQMKHPEEIDALKMPDPYSSGLMPRVLKQIEYFKNHCDLPIGVTDCQGPLTTALSIIGYENFTYWMYDHPEYIHKLMNLCADALIEWVLAQKKLIGVAPEEPGYVLGIKMPDGKGGVWMSDDDSIMFSGGLFNEFVKPYNEKVLLSFGGGGIHYCGCSNQNLDSYMETKGLHFLHNLHLDNFAQVEIARKRCYENGKLFYLADFTPKDERLDAYFDAMVGGLEQRGLILASYVAPAITLDQGRYSEMRRDPIELGQRVAQIIEQKQRKYFVQIKQ